MAFREVTVQFAPLVRITVVAGQQITGRAVRMTPANGDKSEIITLEEATSNQGWVPIGEDAPKPEVGEDGKAEVAFYLPTALRQTIASKWADFEGNLVRITYEGEKVNNKNKRTFHSFKVEVDDGTPI